MMEDITRLLCYRKQAFKLPSGSAVPKKKRSFLLLEFLNDHLLQPRYESLLEKFFS